MAERLKLSIYLTVPTCEFLQFLCTTSKNASPKSILRIGEHEILGGLKSVRRASLKKY